MRTATFVRTGFIAASSYSSSLLNRNNNIFDNIINNNNNNNRIGNNIGSISSSRTRTSCGIMMSSSSSLSGSNNDNDGINTIATTTPDNTKIMNNDNNNDCSRCGIDYPELVVFDLDACFWDQEMYEMSTIPTKKNIVMGSLSLSVDNNNEKGDKDECEDDEGVIGVYSGRNKISLHKGSLLALQEHYIDHKYPGMKICFASSADTPFAEKVGRASLQLLEIIPGVPIWNKLMKTDWNNVDVNQIGRQPPLSSNKAKSHFPRIREMTGIKYDKMLFFDDCNWGDHCGMVAKACKESSTNKGVVTHRTPYGLKESDWRKGLELYKKSSSSSSSQA